MSITYEVNEAIEQESKTPASRVLKQCKEYEKKIEDFISSLPENGKVSKEVISEFVLR